MRELDGQDKRHLEAAEGWIGLGNHAEANAELEEITAKMRVYPAVLKVRWDVSAMAKKWEACLDIAEALVTLEPDVAGGWIHRSFTLHKMKRTQEAFDKLLPAAQSFPRLWTIPYDLACYCAQLGRLEECQAWFKNAMAIDEKTVQRMALDDPELQPLWDSMSGTTWKRW